MKIVKTLLAFAILSFFTSCAKEDLTEMDAFVNDQPVEIIYPEEIAVKRNMETPQIVEVTTDVIRPYKFTTQD